MRIYRISQNKNNDWDTFDSAVMVAENEEQARIMIPYFDNDELDLEEQYIYSSWIKPEDVKVEYIGVADKKYKKPCQICSSFNAG
jgi:hypothetical protein